MSRQTRVTIHLFFIVAYTILFGVMTYLHFMHHTPGTLAAMALCPCAMAFNLVHAFLALEELGSRMVPMAETPIPPSPEVALKSCPPHLWEYENGRMRCQAPNCRAFPGLA